jgi:diadenosine tetraphosphate (Ap4A) HIT family hydrolase
VQYQPNTLAAQEETRDVMTEAINNLTVVTRTGQAELVVPDELIGDVMMIMRFTPGRPSFREWAFQHINDPTDGHGLVVPRDYVADVLTMPIMQTVRQLFREFCLSNLAAIEALDAATHDRLHRMIADKVRV